MLVRQLNDTEKLFRTGTLSRAGTRNGFASLYGERKHGTYAQQSLARPLHLESALRTTAVSRIRNFSAVRIQGRTSEEIVAKHDM
jgi:hypothetical protein